MNSHRDRPLVVAAPSWELARPVAAAIEALRYVDPAFGHAVDTVFESEDADVRARAPFCDPDARPLGETEERALVAACREAWPDVMVRMLLLRRGMADRWFSHGHRAEGVVLVSLHGWDDIAAVPKEAFLAYEIVLWGAVLLSDDYDPYQLLHQKANGCIFEICSEKSRINVKLHKGKVCRRCRRGLRDMNVPEERFQGLVDAIRMLSHARARTA